MVNRHLVTCGLVVLVAAACGQQTSQEKAVADTASPATSAAPAASATAGQVSDADRAAVLTAAGLQANPRGLVKNECDDMVTPQLVPVDLGPTVGPAVLLAMSGGPSLASCYGDGPGLTLFRRDGASWKEIYSSRGGFLAVMREQHNGAPDIVFAGPGFSHPAYEWNGKGYALTTRTVADDRLENAKILP